ncbi:MAG: VCBS repeat-containing protein [Planctomycetota bacterium]
MIHTSPFGRLAASAAALSLLANVASAQRWVDAPLRLEVLDAGFYVDVADFDGDGDPDILGQFLGDVTWAVNDGEGRFSLGPFVDLPVINVYASKAFTDFDGDGNIDMAVAAGDFENPNGVAFFPGTPTGYGPGFLLPTDGAVGRVEAVQLDADPEPELAFLSRPQFPDVTVGWIDFVAGIPTVLSGASITFDGFGANDHAVLDVNGDGLPDQVLVSQNELSIFLTSPGGGLAFDSTITTAHDLGASVSLAAGDLDGDGDRDLLTWESFQGNQTRLIALEVTPGGLVEHPESLVQQNVSSRGFLADWDDDGDLELLGHDITASGDIRWHRVENDGGFDFPTNHSVITPFTGFGGGVGDFDGDGSLDFAGPLHVFWGDSTFGSLYPNEFDGSSSTAPSLIEDFEGDGDTDLVFAGTYLANDGSGSLSFVDGLPSLPDDFFYSSVQGIGDFAGDERDDLLVGLFGPGSMFPFSSFLETRLLVDNGFGVFEDQGPVFPPGVNLGNAADGRIVPFDVDGDMDLDLVTGGTVWTQAADGTFSGATPLVVAGLPAFGGARYQVLDVDDDGVEELLINGFGPNELWLAEPNGGGLTASLLHAGSGIELPVTAVDLGNGPELELIVTDNLQSSAGQVVIVLGEPGGFGATEILPVQSSRMRFSAVDDVTGDGIQDLLVGGRDNGGRGRLLVYEGQGSFLDFAESVEFHTGTAPSGFVDLDEDGDVDLLGSNLINSRRFDGPDAGAIQQYGVGTAGTGGAVPLLGASGPVRPGSTEAGLHLRRGLGGSLALLAVSTTRADLAGVPFPGLTSLVDPLTLLFTLNLTLPGVGPGQGDLDIPVNVSPSLAGNVFTHQFFLVDFASPVFLTHSNGVEIQYGL